MKVSLTFNKLPENWVILAFVLISMVAGICILTSQFYIPFILILLSTYVILMIKFRLIGIITIIALSMGVVNVLALPTITIMGGDFDLRDFMFFLVCFIELIRMLYNKSSFQKNSFATLFIILYLIIGFSIFRSIFFLNLSKVNIFREFRHLMFYSIYFIGLMNIRTKNDIDVILKTIIVLSGIVSLMHIFQGVTGIPIMEGRLETASVGEIEFTGAKRVLSPGIVFVIFSFYYLILNVIYRNYIFSKKYVYLSISLFLAMLIMTFGRMTWISIFFGYFIMAFLLKKTYRKRLLYAFIIGSLILIIAVTVIPVYRTAFTERYLSIFSSETYRGSSLGHRYTENKYALRNIIKNPLLGIGIGNSYSYNLWGSEFKTARTYIHNGYLYFILKFGFLITIPLILLLIKVLHKSYKVSKVKNNIMFSMIGICLIATIFRLLITNITQPDFFHYSTATLIVTLLAIVDCALNLSRDDELSVSI